MLSPEPVMPKCNMDITGKVHSLETFGLVDGPGVRFVAFLQGCKMRCKYCHNPETWDINGGTEWTASQLFQRAYRYHNYWKDNGGITISGGEPLLQIDFVTELFRLAKEKGIHTALDTSGNPFTKEEPFYSKWKTLIQYTDLVLLDLKEMNSENHRSLTGQDNANILEMAKNLSKSNVDIWVRRVLVPGFTDDEAELNKLYEFLKSLGNVKKIEILPYHTLGLFKWKDLHIPYPLDGVSPPTKEQIQAAERILHI
ncbi:MAG: pyruvate formate-lyase-activating protein [Lachnospiraceae bacterium]|nr:pyruvate formate-lyase-activating protein [Lachnospiraceae bacterium]